MKVVESWQNHNGNCYAIVRYSKQEKKRFGSKRFEALWLEDTDTSDSGEPELYSFGGSRGFWIADFDTLRAARDFLLQGISEYEDYPELWLKMVEM